MIVGVALPNPIGWVSDKISDASSAGFEMIVSGLTRWVVDAVVWVVTTVFSFFANAADPDVSAPWFTARDGPYGTTATIGATLLVGFVLAGITQGVLSGDVGGMLRQVGLNLPLSVLGMVGLVSVVQALVELVDALSRGVMSRFEEDMTQFTTVVTSMPSMPGANMNAFIVLLLGVLSVVAGVILIAELVIRSALVYIVVALAPLVFAAQLWPALRGATRKVLELIVALIVSKLVIAIALVVAAAAIASPTSQAHGAALNPPEAGAVDAAQSVSDTVGVLLAAMAAFGVAAFSPLIVTKLIPHTEAALVSQGLRSGPMRAGQQAASLGGRFRGGNGRLSNVANGGQPAPSSSSGSSTGAAGAKGSSGGGAGGGAGAGAVGGAAAAVGIAASAAASGARRVATSAANAAPPPSPDKTHPPAGSPPPEGGRSGSGTPRRPPRAPKPESPS